MKIKFNSEFKVIGRLPVFEQDIIKIEPQLWRADWDFAFQHGGPITKAFLGQLSPWVQGRRIVLDSRVHMLMEGMYPCIPGWHLDDVPRTRPDGQPDHVNPSYKSEHVAAVIGDASLTVFAPGTFELEDVPVGGGVVYAKWHYEIERAVVQRENAYPVSIKELDLVQFGWGSFHRGAPAHKRGWRMFIRASCNTDTPNRNEIRRQTQVYLTEPFSGW